MTQEEKFLLLQDLSARLPYRVIVQVKDWTILDTELKTGHIRLFQDDYLELKPYLRPMSSMTEEECIELGNINATIENVSELIPNIPYYIEVACSKQIDWLNANHFDFRNLIERGLAIAVTEENNPYKDDF